MSESPNAHVTSSPLRPEWTVNQIVAFNMSQLRRERRLTQSELGSHLESLTGRKWSSAVVGAAERSWETERIRKFDANEIVALALIFRVPVGRLLIPPIPSHTKGESSRISDQPWLMAVAPSEWAHGESGTYPNAVASFTAGDLLELIQPLSPTFEYKDRLRRAKELFSEHSLTKPTGMSEVTPKDEEIGGEITPEKSSLVHQMRLARDARARFENIAIEVFERTANEMIDIMIESGWRPDVEDEAT